MAARKGAATRKRRAAGSKVPSVIPMISYEDGIAALEWLATLLDSGRPPVSRADGRLSHGEMEAGDGLIMLASPTPDYQSPKHHREVCKQVRSGRRFPGSSMAYSSMWTTSRPTSDAKAAGARILSDIEEGPPGRRYRAEDLEGHRWFFSRRTTNE